MTEILFARKNEFEVIFDLFMTPEQFGAIPNDTSVTASMANKAAFAAMAAQTSAQKGGYWIFQHGMTYTLFAEGAPFIPGNAYFMADFSNVNGLTIDFNGATISSAVSATNSGNSYTSPVILFNFRNNNSNINILNPRLVHPNAASTVPPSSGSGLIFCNIEDKGENFYFRNIHVQYAREGISIIRTSANRTRNITIENAYFEQVEYPLNAQKNGDDYFARGIRTVNCGRIYFIYNVINHDVELNDDQWGNIVPTVLITVKTLSTETADQNTTANINVRYTSRHNITAGGVNSYAVIGSFEQDDPISSAGIIRDVKVYFDCLAGSPNVTSNNIEMGNKYQATDPITGVALDDTTVRGHVFENIEISGVLDQGGIQNIGIHAFNTHGSWVGETNPPKNIIFRDLIIKNSSNDRDIVIDATTVRDLTLENVHCTQKILITGAAAGVVHYNNVIANNFNSTVLTSIPGVWTASLTGVDNPLLEIAPGTITNVNGGIALLLAPVIASANGVSNTMYGALSTTTCNVSNNDNGTKYGNFSLMEVTLIGTPSVGALCGHAAAINFDGASPGGTVNETNGFYVPSGGGGATGTPNITITDTNGIKIENQGALSGSLGFTQTNAYGLHIADQSGATSNYAIKTGAGKHSFGGAVSILPTVATSTNTAFLLFGSSTGFGIYAGHNSPDTVLTAGKGSLFLRDDGAGVGDRLYVNNNGTTGWSAVTTVS